MSRPPCDVTGIMRASLLFSLPLQQMGSQSGQSADWLHVEWWCNSPGRSLLIDELVYLRLLLILCVCVCVWGGCVHGCVLLFIREHTGRWRYFCWWWWMLWFRLFYRKHRSSCHLQQILHDEIIKPGNDWKHNYILQFSPFACWNSFFLMYFVLSKDVKSCQRNSDLRKHTLCSWAEKWKTSLGYWNKNRRKKTH